MPTLVADDAASRFVADDHVRSQPALSGISINYISKGSLVVLAGKPCLDGKALDSSNGGPTLAAFCSTYKGVYDDLKSKLGSKLALLWVGERVGIAYDAAGMLLDAVTRNHNRTGQPAAYTPNRAAIAQELRATEFKEDSEGFNGATGRTTFAQSRVADNKNLAILLIKDIHDPDSRPTCEYMIGDVYEPESPKQGNGCPRPALLR